MIKENYNICKCDYQHVDSIYEIIQSVKKITVPEIFIPDEYLFIEKHIEERGFVLGSWIDNKLIAYLIVRYPYEDNDNLGLDINIDINEILYVAHIESVAVHPDYRGHNFQKLLINAAEKELDKNYFKYILATVSPQNIYSVNNFLECGYIIKKTIKKYNGFLRHIMYKEIISN